MKNSTLGFDPKYDDSRKENTIYFGEKKQNTNSGNNYRSVSLIIDQGESYISDKNKEDGGLPVEFTIKDNITLYTTDKGQQKYSCWLIESNDSKVIIGLHISRRNKKGVYSTEEVTLNGNAISQLKEFLDKIYLLDTARQQSFKIPVVKQNTESIKIMNEEEFGKLIKENIGSTNDFYKLLAIQKMELGINKLKEIISGTYKNEVEIQKFLKENIWMFGNDYSVIVEDEQINSKNILDLIPKNLEGYVDIIEVKLPNEQLFKHDPSHNNYYTSHNLTKAIAQTQNYIFELEKKTVDDDYQNNNDCKIIKPRGIILYGSKEVLSVDEIKYLRILNSSYHNLYILTYQQLLEKAENVLKINEAL